MSVTRTAARRAFYLASTAATAFTLAAAPASAQSYRPSIADVQDSPNGAALLSIGDTRDTAFGSTLAMAEAHDTAMTASGISILDLSDTPGIM